MSTNCDRNLLLGILALQMDFISREQLIAATNGWMTDKDRSLDELLLEQAALRDDTHPLLVALVDKHLEMHGGDAQKSLAAVSSIGSVREELNKLCDDEIDATLTRVTISPDPADPHSTEVFGTGVNRAGVSSSGVRIPPASLIMRAKCMRFQIMKVVLRLVKSFSGPPDPGSRYEGPGPASPNHTASACGGIT